MNWQPIETAPRDGSLFLSRNADHPSRGAYVTMRSVVWREDSKTGRAICEDQGAWLYVGDNDENEVATRENVGHFIPFSVAADKWNKSVKMEWTPLPSAMSKATQPPPPVDHVPPAVKEEHLARNQPCGCVVCLCEDENYCNGCGAKNCGNHPVGEIPNPVYVDEPHHATEQPDAVQEAARVLLKYMPNYAMETAALESAAKDNAGMDYHSLSELLGATTKKQEYAVVREAICAALRALEGGE